MDKAKRYKMVSVAADHILDMLRQGHSQHIEVISGVPPDAVYIRDYYDYARGTVCFIFEHPGFDLIDFGTIIPEQRIVVKNVTSTPIPEYDTAGVP